MGRISHDRHISYNYCPEFIELWNDQPQHLKNFLEEVGRPYGYTGQNVFYSCILRYAIENKSGFEVPVYRKAF